ncbi:hypothetical protein [Entomomonas moraniae]
MLYHKVKQIFDFTNVKTIK